MKLSSISIAGSSTKLLFTYKKRNPASSTGDYYNSAEITAASIKVLNAETGATILASTAMTYDANLRGYRYVWTYGSGLTGVIAITVEVTPTRAGGVSATLTPIDSEEFPVAHMGNLVWEEATSAHATVGTFGKLEVDAKAATDALQTDFNAFEVTNQTEHDATQAAISVAQASINNATYGLAALNTDLDLILARLGITPDTGGTTTAGTAMAKLNAILANLQAADEAITVSEYRD